MDRGLSLSLSFWYYYGNEKCVFQSFGNNYCWSRQRSTFMSHLRLLRVPRVPIPHLLLLLHPLSSSSLSHSTHPLTTCEFNRYFCRAIDNSVLITDRPSRMLRATVSFSRSFFLYCFLLLPWNLCVQMLPSRMAEEQQCADVMIPERWEVKMGGRI